MAKVASRTVRVTEIPQGTSQEEFRGVVTKLNSRTIGGGRFTTSRHGNSELKFSLATQGDELIGTITLPSEKHKTDALKTHGTKWRLDETFDALTCLFSPREPDLDICAVHGLNGNAFESWVAKKNGTMWLRDLLPTSKPFDKARIMIFGYSSQLSDRANMSGMGEWVHDLLTSISRVRQSAEERHRPIIFICHSMGGLVARQAMVRLNEYTHKPEYEGIGLELCGLLFLSTPHSGSTEADWSDFLTAIGNLTWGIRPEIIKTLKSFNPLSAEGQEDFANMKFQPPFDAFYETHKTKIATFNRHIVTRQSASLNGHSAQPLTGCDHSTICKFEGRFGPFAIVADKLRHLKRLVVGRIGEAVQDPSKPWRPPLNTLNCFQPREKKFFVGEGLNRRIKLRGRVSEIASVNEMIDVCQEEEKGAVAITGIGGMGKTALLLEVAKQQMDQRNIFYIHPKTGDAPSLHKAYLHIVRLVGPEYLLRNDSGRDLHAIWHNQSSEDKIERFKAWLSEPENAQSLFLLDDLDGLQDLDVRAAALPSEANNILYTSRNPVFREPGIRSRHPVRLSLMPLEDIVTVMEDVRDSERDDYEKDADIYDKETLVAIANAVHGHPLAASNAMKYIIQVGSLEKAKSAGRDFVAKLEGLDFVSRRNFLDFNPQPSSIMENFRVSQRRLSDPKGGAWTLMQFLSMLETDDSIVDLDYRDFFFGAIRSIEMDPIVFPDHDVLGAETFEILQLLSEIESVSFGERLKTSKPFRLHPLWLECTRHAMQSKGRLRIITQVLNRCRMALKDSDLRDPAIVRSILPHVRHCVKICKSFKIQIPEWNLPDHIDASVGFQDEQFESLNSVIDALKVLQISAEGKQPETPRQFPATKVTGPKEQQPTPPDTPSIKQPLEKSIPLQQTASEHAPSLPSSQTFYATPSGTAFPAPDPHIANSYYDRAGTYDHLYSYPPSRDYYSAASLFNTFPETGYPQASITAGHTATASGSSRRDRDRDVRDRHGRRG